MNRTRLLLAVFASFLFAACTTDSPTGPRTTPSVEVEVQTGGGARNEMTCEIQEVLPDGTIIWRCSPQVGSGG